MPEIVWDDEYTGPRWRYGMVYRPYTGANIPAGWIIQSIRPDPRFRFGTVDYPFELTPDQVRHAELVPVTIDPV